jgi:hypothetical protein
MKKYIADKIRERLEGPIAPKRPTQNTVADPATNHLPKISRGDLDLLRLKWIAFGAFQN